MQRQTTRTALERRLDYKEWSTIIKQIESIKGEYTILGDISSLGLAGRVRREALSRAARALGRRPRVLVDVGAGPGDSLREAWRLLRPSYLVAVDPSEFLVSSACSGEHRALCDAVIAVAENLPLRSDSADIATTFYAARDYSRLADGLRELIRVSRVVALGDVFVPDNPLARLLVKAWVCIVAPVIAVTVAFLRGLSYRGICSSLKGWCSVESLAEALRAVGRESGYSLAVAARSLVLGGLGYVVAAKSPGGGDGGQRGEVRYTPSEGSCRAGAAGGGDSDEGL